MALRDGGGLAVETPRLRLLPPGRTGEGAQQGQGDCLQVPAERADRLKGHGITGWLTGNLAHRMRQTGTESRHPGGRACPILT
jgi:hypothetical protein